MPSSTKKTFKQGDIIIREGEAGECAYIIETGSVEILIQRQGQWLQIGARGPGAIIGEMAMVDDRPRTATIRATEDCDVMEISRDDFARHVEEADPILQMVLRVIMTRYRDMMGRTEVFKIPHNNTSAEERESADHIRDIAMSAIKIGNELKSAYEQNELVLYYQPIIDIQKMRISGFEALMRWKHPDKGMIPPGIFIPVAEESGLIVDLSKWALGVACDAAKQLQGKAHKDLTSSPLFVGVNFSSKDFSDSDFFGQVEATLEEKETKPDQIHLEITESLLMETPEAAKEALEKCRAYGINVSIDDFGSGYSSLSYLHYFPIDTLKIDQSFIRAMTSHTASLVLVKSIIGLARNLNMKIIAEGIETEEEARTVRDLGCDQCQGYWFAKPMPLEEALKMVESWEPPKL